MQVVHRMPMGTPPTLHSDEESKVHPFVLQPLIVGNPRLVGPTVADDNTVSGTLEVDVGPAVARDQRVVVSLYQITHGEAASFTYVDAPREDPVNMIEVPVAGVGAGDYLVRVQVDGAESPLQVDDVQGSPTYGTYNGPAVTI